MAKNFVQEGNVVTLSLPSGTKSGDGVLVGSLFGIAATDAPAGGGDGEVQLTGVWSLPKDATALIQGAPCYWDSATKKISATAAANKLIGAAVLAADIGVATAKVRLNAQAVV